MEKPGILQPFFIITFCLILLGFIEGISPHTHQNLLHCPLLFSSPILTKAYVLTVSEERWLSTSTLLSQANLNPIRLVPIPLDAPVMTLDGGFNNDDLEKGKFRKYHNNKLSQLKFWKQISYDSTIDDFNGYSLIFEDDIALHRSINISDVQAIIDQTAELSRDAGIFFLGLCAPECRNYVKKNQIKYHECIGPCSHAYGIFKWRAEWLYEELAAVIGDRFRNHIYFFSMDRYIAHGLPSLLGEGPWPYLAGADLSSEIPDHKGIFFQDRVTFQSEANPKSN